MRTMRYINQRIFYLLCTGPTDMTSGSVLHGPRDDRRSSCYVWDLCILRDIPDDSSGHCLDCRCSTNDHRMNPDKLPINNISLQYSYGQRMHRVKWRNGNLLLRHDLHVVGNDAVLCKVNWRRFVTLFKYKCISKF